MSIFMYNNNNNYDNLYGAVTRMHIHVCMALYVCAMQVGP